MLEDVTMGSLAGLWEFEDGDIMMVEPQGVYEVYYQNSACYTKWDIYGPESIVSHGPARRILSHPAFPFYAYGHMEYHAYATQYDSPAQPSPHTSTSWHSCHDNMLDFPIRLEEKGFEPWYVCKVAGCGKAVKKHEV